MVFKTKRKTRRNSKRTKSKIQNVPLADKQSLGAKASEGVIEYHFQNWSSLFLFVRQLVTQDPVIRSRVCVVDSDKLGLITMLVTGFNAQHNTLPIKPYNEAISMKQFKQSVQKCKNYRFLPVPIHVLVPSIGAHANVLLFDLKQKTVELFEPHGNYSRESELEDVPRGYVRISKRVKQFVTKYFRGYRYIHPKQYEPKRGLQARLDVYTGACIAWCMLYLHYRFLNPDVSLQRLTTHIDKYMTKSRLLRYIRYTEELIKQTP